MMHFTRIVVVTLPLVLAACASATDVGGISYTDDRGVSDQPFPASYRTELQSFFRTYLNDPAGVRDPQMAEPLQRKVGGRLRYVSCVRYTPRNMDGVYRQPQLRGIMYVDGRLDRVIEDANELCSGATYLPFPELQNLSR